MRLALFSIGLISILGQVVLLRELNVAFYGVELIYLAALGVWLFWTALGALTGRRNHLPSHNHIAILFLIFGMVMIVDVAFIRSSRLISGGIPGAYLDFLQQLIILNIAILPAGLLSGLLFQWAARAYVSPGRTLAAAYAIESAGGLIGGLFSTILMMWGLNNFSIALLCSCIAVLTPLIALTESKIILRRTAMILVFVFPALLWNISCLDNAMTAWNHPNLLKSGDSPYGRITITKSHLQISVFENDALSFETEGTDAEYFCHLVALQHPDPQRVLLLGGGMEGITAEMLKYKPQRIDYVELNPFALKIVRTFTTEDIRSSLRAPNVHIIFADPRQYLRKSGNYDLIIVGMPQPESGQANRFYTQEFFRQCSAKLNPGGIVGFRLRTAENLWTTPLARRSAGIYAALQSVFPEVLFLPGATNVVTASLSPLPVTPEMMSRRLQNLKTETKLISPDYIRYLFTNDRFFEIRDLFKKEKSPPNTDVRPVCYQYSFMVWLSKFFPRVALVNPDAIINKGFFQPPLVFLWMIIPLIFSVSRLIPGLRRVLLAATAGFLGMILETILILYYQAKHGVLYQDIGLLMMSFMAGLALGAITTGKLMTRSTNKNLQRRQGIGLVVALCFLSVLISMILSARSPSGLMTISILLAMTGFFVAGIFAYVSLHEIADQKKVISPLYSADLIGGCAGSMLGSLVLIPLLGMDVVTRGMIALAVFSMLLV